MKRLKWFYGWLLVGIYGLILFLLIGPHILVTLAISRLCRDSPSRQRVRLGRLHCFWGIGTWYFVRIFLWMRVEIEIDSYLVQGGPFITTANHRTALDHVMIYVAARAAGIKDLRWVLRRSMRKAPIIGWLNELMGSAFLSRDKDREDFARLERTARFALEDGASTHIYPEGTRFRGVFERNTRFRHVLEPLRGGYGQFVRTLPSHRTLSITLDWGRQTGGTKIGAVSDFLGRCVRIRILDKGIVEPDQVDRVLNECWAAHEFYLHDSPES